MGKAPTRTYPYSKHTLLGNTLYVGSSSSIKHNEFRNNLNIYKAIVPKGSTSLGYGFFGCSNLTSIVLPKTLTSMG
jgi:hypothetical protein